MTLLRRERTGRGGVDVLMGKMMEWGRTERLRMSVMWGRRRRGHERTGRGHERNDYWLDGNGSDLRLVRTRNEKSGEGGGGGKGDRCRLRSLCLYQDAERPR
jgi:hypothetical protein